MIKEKQLLLCRDTQFTLFISNKRVVVCVYIYIDEATLSLGFKNNFIYYFAFLDVNLHRKTLYDITFGSIQNVKDFNWKSTWKLICIQIWLPINFNYEEQSTASLYQRWWHRTTLIFTKVNIVDFMNSSSFLCIVFVLC